MSKASNPAATNQDRKLSASKLKHSAIARASENPLICESREMTENELTEVSAGAATRFDPYKNFKF